MPDARVDPHRFADDGIIPNSPLPLLVYRGAIDAERDPAARFEALFGANGWSGSWRNGIYDYHHYHSTAHEVLGIARGSARVRFGGEKGSVLEVQAGDVVVIPAGVAHKNEGASRDLLVVGAYPGGIGPDICTGKPDERPAVLDNIRAVPLPAGDPVHGREGPLRTLWSRTAEA